MLLTETSALFENDYIILDLDKNIITFKKKDITIPLSALQGRLFLALVQGITKKREIIKRVWEDNHISICDNNYHQLIYQCRLLFSRHGIPGHVLKTLHRHGVKFNFSALDENLDLKKPSRQAGRPCRLKLLLKKRHLYGFFLLLAGCACTVLAMISGH